MLPLAAVQAVEDGWVGDAAVQLQEMTEQLDRWGEVDGDLLGMDVMAARLSELRTKATECIGETAKRITQFDDRITVLGEKLEGESSEISDQRTGFERDRAAAQTQLAKCRLLLLEADALTSTLQRLRQQVISEKLSARSLTIWNAVLALPSENLRATLMPWQLRYSGTLGWLWTLIFALLALMPIGLVGAKQLAERARAIREASPRLSVLLASYSRRLPVVLLIVSAASAMLWLGMQAYPILLLALALAILTSPLLDGLFAITRYTQGLNTLPVRLLWTVALLSIAAYSLEAYRAEDLSPAITIIRSLILSTLFASAAWMLMTLVRKGTLFGIPGLHWPVLLLLLIGPLAFILGYHNLSGYLARGVYGSILVGFLGWLVYLFLLYLLNQFPYVADTKTSAAQEEDPGKPAAASGTEQTVKKSASLGRRLALYGVWLVTGMVVLRIWSFTPGEPLYLLQPLTLSYEFGAITIVPSKWLSGILLFMLFWIIARLVTSSIGKYWLVKDSASRGARESVLTLTSYAIIAIGVFFGISAAGLELSNLAIIAGALSVGIGFGLQNIVNNFVSGLILLFERPIRPGDWVVIGNTEGHVRHIRIRSTLIETFDRSEVMVPNSDMLNSHLINRTFSDGLGRITVPVGVAYGSDKQLVRDLMLSAAREHPLVLSNDPRVPTPRVLFMSFGDNSLNFELRCYVRDIDLRSSILSDLLFAIDDAFREYAIEIPFPQRVVHTSAAPAPAKPTVEPPERL